MNTDILHVLDKYFPPDPRVEGEIQALIDYGFKVSLIAISRDNEKGFFHTKYLCPIQKIRIKRITYKLSALAYTIPLYHLLVAPGLYKHVKKMNPKVIHVHDIRIARTIRWISRITKVPYVLDLHENRPEIMKEYSFVKSKMGRLLISLKKWRKNEIKLIKAALKTVVVTNAAAEYYIERDNFSLDNFIVTTNTTSEDFNNGFVPSIDQLDELNIRILYIGDTSERRGIMDVLKALIISKDKGFKFDILGSSSFDPTISSIIESEQLGQKVQMHGWVGQQEIHKALSRADIGISPLVRNVLFPLKNWTS